QKVNELFDMRPYAIEKRLQLRTPIYSESAAYGHMGRESFEKNVEVNYVTVSESGGIKTEVRTTSNNKITFFGWEKLDWVSTIKSEFGI
ncbi:MAG TPA: methionine adenosyltransferase domain-containing protein, partial [Catalimonadaceae bacterium]|nr:methionine adenosyltransferase domain-containing protein [Catalimonadaceae bacterium]